jgi:hypothetical protein
MEYIKLPNIRRSLETLGTRYFRSSFRPLTQNYAGQDLKRKKKKKEDKGRKNRGGEE